MAEEKNFHGGNTEIIWIKIEKLIWSYPKSQIFSNKWSIEEHSYFEIMVSVPIFYTISRVDAFTLAIVVLEKNSLIICYY